MKRLVAIGSGKGGVGKTWFAITLSHTLARRGFKVLLVDCDLGLANVEVQLGQRSARDLGRALGQAKDLASCITTIQPTGFDLLAARSGAALSAALDLPLAERLLCEIKTWRDRYDLVLLDLPSGNDLGMRCLMMAADDPILVTSEEPTALTDAYAVIKAVHKRMPGFRPAVIVNAVDDHQCGARIVEGLSRVCDRFLAMTPVPLGSIRRDRRVAEAISRQTPLLQCYPKTDAAEDVAALAALLVDRSRSLP